MYDIVETVELLLLLRLETMLVMLSVLSHICSIVRSCTWCLCQWLRDGHVSGAPHQRKAGPFSHIRVARIFSAGASLGVHFSSSKKLTTFFSRRYV